MIHLVMFSAGSIEILENATYLCSWYRRLQVLKILGLQYRIEEEIKGLESSMDFRVALLRGVGRRVPASYVNTCIRNNIVIVSSYNDPNDKLIGFGVVPRIILCCS
ncbi:uncharacterized protein Gasu_54030 [Galdieria sulphuraria]|uniref:Uncharacterized protein n=1 Tax=Galdieria sulphuraria TaxID=130081 RepID=M2XU68_GALSU|nr:uncharacterized protein Gasu_54030 [Galdieria sulphuraria]EME26949.1 hypothetical protein Gasu_54030 [Galdieria sulphuraria]|eukprot:XP_005703469.1 hypothetical protein Gasu_54030 [Galdieria sulphuraria]